MDNSGDGINDDGGPLGWAENPERRKGTAQDSYHCMLMVAGGVAGKRDGEYVSTSTFCRLYCSSSVAKNMFVRSCVSRSCDLCVLGGVWRGGGWHELAVRVVDRRSGIGTGIFRGNVLFQVGPCVWRRAGRRVVEVVVRGGCRGGKVVAGQHALDALHGREEVGYLGRGEVGQALVAAERAD